jgi:hypothetical protein
MSKASTTAEREMLYKVHKGFEDEILIPKPTGDPENVLLAFSQFISPRFYYKLPLSIRSS